MIPDWVASYVGLPFKDHGRDLEGLDCWGLVRFILKQHYGIDTPDFGSNYSDTDDTVSVPQAIKGGLPGTWLSTASPQAGDLIIIAIAGKPMHCGMVVAPGYMLHCVPNPGSCIESYDRPKWKRRVEGIYRHRSLL